MKKIFSFDSNQTNEQTFRIEDSISELIFKQNLKLATPHDVGLRDVDLTTVTLVLNTPRQNNIVIYDNVPLSVLAHVSGAFKKLTVVDDENATYRIGLTVMGNIQLKDGAYLELTLKQDRVKKVQLDIFKETSPVTSKSFFVVDSEYIQPNVEKTIITKNNIFVIAPIETNGSNVRTIEQKFVNSNNESFSKVVEINQDSLTRNISEDFFPYINISSLQQQRTHAVFPMMYNGVSVDEVKLKSSQAMEIQTVAIKQYLQ